MKYFIDSIKDYGLIRNCILKVIKKKSINIRSFATTQLNKQYIE